MICDWQASADSVNQLQKQGFKYDYVLAPSTNIFPFHLKVAQWDIIILFDNKPAASYLELLCPQPKVHNSLFKLGIFITVSIS